MPFTIQAARRFPAADQAFMADKRSTPGTNKELGVATKTKPKTKKPSLYRVLLLNDDYTPMEFVVLVLEHFFNKSREEATTIMLHSARMAQPRYGRT